MEKETLPNQYQLKHRSNARDHPVKKPVILITGCGSGLGFALAARMHSKSQYRVMATVRSERDLAKLRKRFPENDDFKWQAMDVTDNVGRERVVAQMLERWKRIDVLINNAGVLYRSVVEHMDDETELNQLDVNYLGPMSLIRLVVPVMREQKHGKIINISSASGMVSMPTMSSYSASKHALEGASEALWYELETYGIHVTLIQPGFINSNSFKKVRFSRKAALSEALEGPYSTYYRFMAPFTSRLMRLTPSRPMDIAKKIEKIIKSDKPPLWLPVTPDAVLFYWMKRLLPRGLFLRFMSLFLPGRPIHGLAEKLLRVDSHSVSNTLQGVDRKS